MIKCIVIILLILLVYKLVIQNNIESFDEEEKKNNNYIIYIILGTVIVIISITILIYMTRGKKKSAFNKSAFEDYEKNVGEFYKWYDKSPDLTGYLKKPMSYRK